MGQFLGGVRIGACRVGEPVNPGCIRRETGLKPLNGFRLKGVLTYCESLHSFESGTHEIRNLFVETAHSCTLLEFFAYNSDILAQLPHGFFAAKPRGRLSS